MSVTDCYYEHCSHFRRLLLSFTVCYNISHPEPEDYELTLDNSVLQFQAGSTSACLNIDIIDDTLLEGTHFFLVMIPDDQTDPAVAVSSNSAAVVLIEDPEDGKFQCHGEDDPL